MEYMYLKASSDNRFLFKGKWASPYAPKRAWVCIHWEDLGEPQKVCEMCESQTIRYVHHMWHHHYQKVLEVGCTCAGYMEGILWASKARQNALKRRESERKTWVSRSWKIDPYEMGFIKRSGPYAVAVKRCGQGWAVAIYTADLERLIHRPEKTVFITMEEAKLYAFDYLDPYSHLILPEGRITIPFLQQRESGKH